MNVKGEDFVDGFRVLMDENFWESIVKEKLDELFMVCWENEKFMNELDFLKSKYSDLEKDEENFNKMYEKEFEDFFERER